LASPGFWIHSLVVMNNSARGMPLLPTARPTASSFPYEAAVSMCRYPTSSAVATASSVCPGGTWKTSKPTIGISTALFSVTFGIVLTWTLLSFVVFHHRLNHDAATRGRPRCIRYCQTSLGPLGDPPRQGPPHRRQVHHPVVGDLTLDYETLDFPADSSQKFIVYSAEPASPAGRHCARSALVPLGSEAGLREHAGRLGPGSCFAPGDERTFVAMVSNWRHGFKFAWQLPDPEPDGPGLV
jgi:MmyB-like transcription regulator ligand binding domain